MANFSISATTLTFPDGTTQTTAAQSIPSTTKLTFLQAAAPTGWTQCTTNNDFAIRIVNTTGGGTGGTVNFTTAFASQTPAGNVGISGGSVAATTLATCQIPSHGHPLLQRSGNCGATGHTNVATSTTCNYTYAYNNSGGGGINWVGNTGSSGSHTHSFTAPTGSFTGTALNLAVKYINAIVATKN